MWGAGLDELGVGGEERDGGVQCVVGVAYVVKAQDDVGVGARANPVWRGGVQGAGGGRGACGCGGTWALGYMHCRGIGGMCPAEAWGWGVVGVGLVVCIGRESRPRVGADESPVREPGSGICALKWASGSDDEVADGEGGEGAR